MPAPGLPLVSCVMVTGGRPEYLRQAIRYFHRQDYPSRELVIVDDGPEDLAGELRHPGLRYRHLPAGLSIGAKRNIGCELAAGQFIAQWDDDDWYGPGRLSYQIGPLLVDGADIVGLKAGIFFDLARWQFWMCSDALHRRMFVEDVHGGTLVYRRSVWERGARYPDASLAEDAEFLRRTLRAGHRLTRMSNPKAFMYLRHEANTWSFACGSHVDPSGWTQVGEPLLPPADRSFYLACRETRPFAR